MSTGWSAAALLNPLQRQVLTLFPERLVLLETHIETLDKSVAEALRQYQVAVRRLAEVPGRPKAVWAVAPRMCSFVIGRPWFVLLKSRTAPRRAQTESEPL